MSGPLEMKFGEEFADHGFKMSPWQFNISPDIKEMNEELVDHQIY
jgi:hypothetical protein